MVCARARARACVCARTRVSVCVVGWGIQERNVLRRSMLMAAKVHLVYSTSQEFQHQQEENEFTIPFCGRLSSTRPCLLLRLA